MNFLAHAVLGELAGHSPALGLLGDFVRGRPQDRYAGAALDAIVLHRRLDRFVDVHPGHRAARARLDPPWRRYAGVLVDIYFDHLLARDFEHLTGRPLQAYTHAVYAQLEAHAEGLPTPLNRFAARAREKDLLAAYRDPATLAEVLDGIGRRLRRPLPLGQALAPLRDADAALAADFEALWPDAVAFARSHAGESA